jgi:hypothetical protein
LTEAAVYSGVLKKYLAENAETQGSEKKEIAPAILLARDSM